MEKLLVDIKEAARILSISPRTLYKRVAPKSKDPFPVRPKRIGRSVRFDRRELERYVEKGCDNNIRN